MWINPFQKPGLHFVYLCVFIFATGILKIKERNEQTKNTEKHFDTFIRDLCEKIQTGYVIQHYICSYIQTVYLFFWKC